MKRALYALIMAALAIGLVWFVTQHRRVDIGPQLAACMQEQDRQRCLRTRLPELLSRVSTADVLSYIVASTSEQIVVSNCHFIAHETGEATYLRTHSLEQSLSQCTNACNYGCVHGAIAAEVAHSLGSDYIDEDLAHSNQVEIQERGKKYCEQSVTLCHGIGHIARIATDTLHDALTLCNGIAHGLALDRCYRGVFMEDVGEISFVPKQFSNPSSDYGYPCNTLDQKYDRACYVQLGMYQKVIFQKNAVAHEEQEKIRTHECDILAGTRREFCFFGAGYATNDDNTQRFDGPGYCASLPGRDNLACVEGLAYNYASFSRYDQVFSFCDTQTSEQVKNSCYRIAFDAMSLPVHKIQELCDQSGSRMCSVQLQTYAKKAENR